MTGTRGGPTNGGARRRLEVSGVRGARKSLTGRDAAWADAPGIIKRIESAGARTPEELETLLEDALVIRDGEALAALFGSGAALVTGGERPARRRDRAVGAGDVGR